jgi:hypothetical protein
VSRDPRVACGGLARRYAWRVARRAIDRLVAVSDPTGTVAVGWEKAQLIIDAWSRLYRRRGHGVHEARAMAWEDFDVAARGRGEPGISGAVFAFWSSVPGPLDEFYRVGIEVALGAAQAATEPTSLRYRPADRCDRVRTLDDGFDLPEAVPREREPLGVRPYAWAIAHLTKDSGGQGRAVLLFPGGTWKGPGFRGEN